MVTRRTPRDPGAASALQDSQLRSVIGYQLALAAVVANRFYDQAVGEPQDLHRLEYSLLMLVGENPGCTASSLARSLGISTPNMVLWLDRVMSKALVERETSPSDRRAYHLQLTARGRQVADEATAALHAAERAGLAHLTFGERALLGELLHKIAQPARAAGA